MTYKDYYKIMGIGKNAAPAEIRKAYRSLANKYHPDKTKGSKAAEEKFKEINEANEVLSDSVKRKTYDQFGAEWKHYEEAGAKPGGFDWSKYANDRSGRSQRSAQNQSSANFSDESVNDLFEMLFGQHSGQRQGRRNTSIDGEDLSTETILSLDEAYYGTTRLIKVNDQTIKVTIKPGVADRQKLRIAQKGRAGSNSGKNGDLILTINIAQHPKFRRSGNDLRGTMQVGLYDALLGGKSQFKTLKSNVVVNIPKGTPNGKELRLGGLGMPIYGKKNEFGDLIVKVDILLPELLCEEEIQLFKTLTALRK